jgi:hypothetical protein
MGASSAASVARASQHAGGGATASGARAAPVVSGLPAYMTVVDAGASGGAAQARIEALQQQEQTEDRGVAEALADRIGQTDARESMQAEDARQAAQTDTAQQGREAAQQATQAGGEAVWRASQPQDMVSRMDDGTGLVAPGGGPVWPRADQVSRADGEQAGAASRGPGASGAGAGGGPGGVAGGGATAEGAPGGAGGSAGAGGAAGVTGPGGDAAGGAGPAGAGGTSAEGPQAEDVPRGATPAEPDTGAGALDTGDLVLIDVELAEHQRWAAAQGVVGEAGSMQRAEFIAQSAGGGFIGGVASGAAMGLGIGLVSRAVPVLGPIIGGGMALHGLLTRDWAATGATIGKFGQGSDTYDTLANTLASVSAVIDVVNGVLDTIGGIVGIVEAVAIGVAAGAGVLAFFTFGATAGIAIAAGELAADCEEIREGISAVTTVLNEINNALLNPCILLFRALHEFTADADPREIESGGHDLAGAAGAIGGALGGWLGGQAAHIGARPPPQEGEGTTQRPPHESPPAAAGEGPEVHFQEPPMAPVVPDAPVTPAARPAETPAEGPFYGITDTTPSAATPASTEGATPAASTPAPVTTPQPAPAQLELPGVPQQPSRGVPRRQTPDEIAPAGTHSAYLRRLRAEAAGTQATLQPSHDPYNIARHQPPTAQGTARDLYQPSPRPVQPVQESHHLEHQEYLRGDADHPGVAGYRANEDVTIDLPVDEHHALRAPQGAMETPAQSPITRVELGRAASVEQAMNLIQYGQLTPPPPGTPSRVPPGVAGQLAMEHMSYLFSLSPVQSGPTELTPPVNGIAGMHGPVQRADALPSRAHRHPGRPRPLARDTELPPVMGPRTPPEWDNDDAVWARTFDQPDPAMVAAPSGTQFDMWGSPAPPPRAEPVQQSLALPERPQVSRAQTELPFGPSGGGSSGPVMPVSEPSSGDPTRNQQALTAAQRQHLEDAALRYGASPDSLMHTDSRTGYEPGRDRVHLGPDAFPLPPEQRPTGGSNPANPQLGPDAAIAHEVIGHREAALGGATRPHPQLEEAQASIRAGLHASDLPDEERSLLFQDAAARVPEEMRDDDIYMDVERYGPAAEARRPPGGGGGRGADAEPSVVIDPSLYEAPGTPAQRGTPLPPEPEPEPPGAGRPAGAAPGTTPTTRPAGPAPAGAGPSGGAGTSASHAPPSRVHQVAALFLPQVFGGGEAPTYAQQQAAHRAEFTDDNQPAAGVERVNPHYSSPPGTPDQVVALQNEILNLLAVRARAEAESQHEGERVEACEENRAPIAATLADTRGGLSAVRAHEQAVTRRDAANQAQQQRQQESEGLTSGYPDRATGLTVLEVPLAAWEGFTSLASHLPGSAGDKMGEMNAEARKMQDAFAQMGEHMSGADGEQPGRAAALADDSARIGATGEQAQSSHEQLQSAADGAVGVQSANDATLAAAQERQQAADQRSDDLGAAADDRQAQADSLAAQMRAWAQTHHDERAQAIGGTAARLQGEGKIITESPQE